MIAPLLLVNINFLFYAFLYRITEKWYCKDANLLFCIVSYFRTCDIYFSKLKG